VYSRNVWGNDTTAAGMFLTLLQGGIDALATPPVQSWLNDNPEHKQSASDATSGGEKVLSVVATCDHAGVPGGNTHIMLFESDAHNPSLVRLRLNSAPGSGTSHNPVVMLYRSQEEPAPTPTITFENLSQCGNCNTKNAVVQAIDCDCGRRAFPRRSVDSLACSICGGTHAVLFKWKNEHCDGRRCGQTFVNHYRELELITTPVARRGGEHFDIFVDLRLKEWFASMNITVKLLVPAAAAVSASVVGTVAGVVLRVCFSISCSCMHVV